MKKEMTLKSKIRAIVAIVIVVVLGLLSLKVFEDANKSKNYVVQMPFTGQYHTWTDGGLQL